MLDIAQWQRHIELLFEQKKVALALFKLRYAIAGLDEFTSISKVNEIKKMRALQSTACKALCLGRVRGEYSHLGDNPPFWNTRRDFCDFSINLGINSAGFD